MADVQWYDESAATWKTIDQAMWRVENGVSSKMPAPRAVIETNANVDLLPNTDIRIREGTEPIFVGYTRNGGEYGDRGQQRINCRSEAYKILNEEVSVSVTSGTDADVISTAISNTSRSTDFSLSYPETAINIGDYDATERKLKVILRDMADRTGRVWYFTSDANTLSIQSLGYRGTWETLETGTDNIAIEKWNGGEIDAVQNSITVTGTGSDPVTSDTIEDTNSIDKYGRQSASYSYRWIQTKTQANDLANQLLIPEPLESGKVTIPETAVSGNTWDNLSNYTIDLSDSTRGINSVLATIEKQVIQEGRTTLYVGKGVSYAESSINRNSQSQQDAVRTNYTQLEGTLDDIDDGSTYGKILDSAISSGRHTLSAAVGDLDNIDDGGTYARVRDGNVDANNYVLLATSTGDLDDIDDGTNYGRVNSTALDAGEIILAQANGDLDDISDGTNFGKVDITHLTSGGAVFATGIELDDGRNLSQITADDGGVTVIDGGEILTGSITANEIDTLYLETGKLRIGTETSDEFQFSVDSTTDSPQMNTTTDGKGLIGESGSKIAGVYTDIISTDAFTAGQNSAIADKILPDIDGGGSVGDSTRTWDSLFIDKIQTQTTFTEADYDFLIGENPMAGKTGPAIWPSTSSRAEVGTGDGTTDDKAIGSVHTINLYQYSPEPLSPDDPRSDTPADGGRPIDLDELQNSTWYDPPEYAAQGKDPETGEYRKNPKREDGTRGVELGHMTNYIFEVTKRLARERDELQNQIDTLESRLSKLESKVGE